MESVSATPPDIASLTERVRLLGSQILASRDEIEVLKAPFTPDREWVMAPRTRLPGGRSSA